ncbi:hypothetical protein PLCT2_02958 [Planctomycetaceae bacterium]|nr:hypothetical protein PLCT2_02958 [Planctomycetaceae bacterium]
MALVSVNKPRSGENVAWRAWAVSPKIHSGEYEWFLHNAIKFMVDNSILALGWADERLTDYPGTWPKFEAKTGYPPVVFYFARRMKKGDLIVLGRNRGFIEAYGYLKDDELRYIDDRHDLAGILGRMQAQSKRIYKAVGRDSDFESMRNYRLVEQWIPFKGPPRNNSGLIEGNYRATVAAIPLQKAKHWLGLADTNQATDMGTDDGEE